MNLLPVATQYDPFQATNFPPPFVKGLVERAVQLIPSELLAIDTEYAVFAPTASQYNPFQATPNVAPPAPKTLVVPYQVVPSYE